VIALPTCAQLHSRLKPASLFTALTHWQAGVGSVLGGWAADRLGRKAALLLADVLFAAGSAAMAAAQEHWALIAGGCAGCAGLPRAAGCCAAPLILQQMVQCITTGTDTAAVQHLPVCLASASPVCWCRPCAGGAGRGPGVGYSARLQCAECCVCSALVLGRYSKQAVGQQVHMLT